MQLNPYVYELIGDYLSVFKRSNRTACLSYERG